MILMDVIQIATLSLIHIAILDLNQTNAMSAETTL